MDEVCHSLASEKEKNGKEQENSLSAFELFNTCSKLIEQTIALREESLSLPRAKVLAPIIDFLKVLSIYFQREGREKER